MDVHAAIGCERTVRGIVALLVSLAALADQAAARSCVVRFVVLLILRRAEAEAQDYFLDVAGLPLPAHADAAIGGYASVDALRLAARLAALAAAFAMLLPAAGRPGRRPDARNVAIFGRAAGSGRGFAGGLQWPDDTS